MRFLNPEMLELRKRLSWLAISLLDELARNLSAVEFNGSIKTEMMGTKVCIGKKN